MKTILALAPLFLLAACTTAPEGPRQPAMLGGKAVSSADYPGMVWLWRGTFNGFCTAGVIGARKLLTAAHCVAAAPPKNANDTAAWSIEAESTISIGTQPRSSPQSNLRLTVKNIFVHPSALIASGENLYFRMPAKGFENLPYFDIAIIETVEDIPHPPAVLSTRPIQVKDQIRIGGYGTGTETPTDLEGSLNQIQKIGTHYFNVTRKNLDKKHVALVQGDSGGPAYVLENGVPKVVAIFSVLGSGALIGSNAGWLLNVSPGSGPRPWIDQVLAGKIAPSSPYSESL